MNIKTKTVDVKADNGSIKGYAATWTRTPDSYGDVIVKGAFADSIAQIDAEGKTLPLLWNHDSSDLKAYIGTVKSLEEDDHGLLFEADFDATPEAQRARELASDGRLCKFSFAYDVIDQATVELEDGTEANELRKLNIHEVSLVMYPANRDTSIVEVKNSIKEVIEVCEKVGRRNSAKDQDALIEVAEHLRASAIIIDGLLEEAKPDEQEQETETEEKVNAEEPDTVNAEEPDSKAEVETLLQQAKELLKGEVE